MELTIEQRDEELREEMKAKEESDRILKQRDKESKVLKTQLDKLRERIQACDDEKGVFQKQVDKLDKVYSYPVSKLYYGTYSHYW